MSTNEKFPLVVWIGRYSGSSGLAVAAKGQIAALRSYGVDVVQLDLDSCEIVGPPVKQSYSVKKSDKQIILESKDVPMVVVFNDTPDKLSRVLASGASRLIASSMFETASIPSTWLTPLLSVDEVWVPSDFNVATFADAGVPRDALKKIPLALGRGIFTTSPSKLKLGQKGYTFLSMVSNYNRKDVGLLLRAYFKAFTAADDVSLIVKLPNKTEQSLFDKFVLEAVEPEFDLLDPNLPHVIFLMGSLSNEKIIGLAATCDCYVSTERGKGWDLPAMEAMALGKPTVGINWSGNTEFMKADNSLLVEPEDRLVDTDPTLFQNVGYYAGHQWSYVSDDAIADAMSTMHRDRARAKELGQAARAHIFEHFTEASIGRQIIARIEEFDVSSYRGHKAGRIVVGQGAPVAIPRASKGADYEDVVELYPALSKAPSIAVLKNEAERDAWIDERRRIFGSHGTVMPPMPERARLNALRDRHLGQKIVIVGNGPSLRKVDFEKLKGVSTFAANKINLLYDKTEWRPTYYTCLDWRVTPDNFENTNSLGDGTTFFFPFRFNGMLREGDDVYWYESVSAGVAFEDKFERDAYYPVKGGGTVLTAAIQLAWFLGFRDFALVGVDASYSIPESVTQSGGDRFGAGVQINLTSTQDDDANHFDPRYFGTAARWHDPNVPEMIRGFTACRRAIEFHGGRIVNATEGGKLEALDRMTLDAWLESDRRAG